MNWFAVIALIGGIAFATSGALALWRFTRLRSTGIPVAMRELPAAGDGHGWRHGVLLCSDLDARFYKLRSLRPGADIELHRQRVELTSRRDPTRIEAGIFGSGVRVLVLDAGEAGRIEMAADACADTALVAWLESSPSVRQTRTLPVDIERTFRSQRARSRRR